MLSQLWLALLGLAFVALADDQAVLQDTQRHATRPRRIAIIGAGAGGASAAYYLHQFAAEANIDLELTVYERNSYVGGRSTTVDAYDDPSQPVELGASIFVEANLNLVNATKALNLSLSNYSLVTDDGTPELGVWNGENFVFIQESNTNFYWDLIKLAWKYGLAPFKAVRLMRAVVAKFLKMYDEPYFPFESLSDVAYELGLTAVTAATGRQYLDENSIGAAFSEEIVQASTRVNYAQNLSQIHALEAMVCLATDGARSVHGGNWRIFGGMIKESGAAVHLHTAVQQVTKLYNGSYTITYKYGGFLPPQESQAFDDVVLAAPYQFSNIKWDNFTEPPTIDEIPYVNLHVTLFASPHRLSPVRFNMPAGKKVPNTVLTTLPQRNGDGAPNFFSISTLRSTVDPRQGSSGQTEHLYKIFSAQPIDLAFLHDIFGLRPTNDTVIVGKDFTWALKYQWHSYPYEYPRITFEKIELDRGLWYTSGIESFISTMETSSLMGKNVARLIADRWSK